MESDFNILNEINSTKSDTYKVPENYFEGLATSILLKIRGQKNSYFVPVGYFENLSDSILQKIKSNNSNNKINEELSVIAPSLIAVRNINCYTVPENYFETFSLRVYNKPTKIVSLHSKFTFVKYAAAAVIVSVIAFGGFFSSKNNDQTYAMYNATKNIDIEKSISNLSDNEIRKVLNADQSLASNSNTTSALPYKNLDDLNQEFQYVTDEEMESYITENNITITIN